MPLIKISEDDEFVYDLVGIGFGPSNIALAVALEEIDKLKNTVFLEANSSSTWQPGMLLSGSDIQHNPLRDFVTPRNPRSKFGFLSYLKDVGRLWEFLNLEAPFPPRSEYAEYVFWVAKQFNEVVNYSVYIDNIDLVQDKAGNLQFKVSSGSRNWFAKNVSLAPGRSFNIPKMFEGKLSQRIVHFSDYNKSFDQWRKDGVKHITVVGSSQSACEIILDILRRDDSIHVTNLARSFGFKLKDVSPFTERIYFPEFVDYFFNAKEEHQHSLTQELWTSNYSAADHDVIAELNMMLYEQKVTGNKRFDLNFNRDIKSLTNGIDSIKINFVDKYSSIENEISTDAIILATGFKNFGLGDSKEPFHPLLDGIKKYFSFRKDGGLFVNYDYSLKFLENGENLPKIFVNGLCESTHGFGDAGSFSLLSHRSSIICQGMFSDTVEESTDIQSVSSLS